CGVYLQSVTRRGARFLDFALFTEQQTLGKHLANEGLLQRVQAVVSDLPEEGLSAVMDDFFQGFQELSSSPMDQTARFQVVDAGQQLAQTFNLMRAPLDQIKTDNTIEINQRVAEANDLITQIAALNGQIVPLSFTAATRNA